MYTHRFEYLLQKMATKRCYNTNEALKFILEPNTDSELPDLNNDENQEITLSNATSLCQTVRSLEPYCP